MLVLGPLGGDERHGTLEDGHDKQQSDHMRRTMSSRRVEVVTQRSTYIRASGGTGLIDLVEGGVFGTLISLL